MKKTFLLITVVALSGMTAMAQQYDAGLKQPAGKPQLATERSAKSKSEVKSEKPAPPALPAAVSAEKAITDDAAKQAKPVVPGSPVFLDRYDVNKGAVKTDYQSKPPILPAPKEAQQKAVQTEVAKPPVKPQPVAEVQKNG